MIKLIPILTKQEKQEIVTYYTVYEKYADEFSKKATEDLKDHPVFGKLIRDIPKDVSEANDKLSRELQKDAIINNNWQPYIEYQMEQGRAYAKMGLDFKSWYEVVALVRNYITPYLQKEYGSGAEFISSLNGMNRFLDIAMGIIGEAYMQEKEGMIKQANENLQKNIKEISDYKYALDESSIVAITDQKGIITYTNDNFCKISKYSREELIGQDHRIINSGYHPKEFIRELWITIANGKIWRGKLKNKAKDGTIYWVDTTIVPFLNEIGKPYQYVAIRADITQQKKAQLEIQKLNEELEQKVIDRTAQLESNIQQLKESEEKYSMLFNSIDEGFCIIEMIFDEQKKPVDYRFLTNNASFEKQTGLHDAVGKRMRELAPDHEEHWFEIYGKIALTGESLRFENQAEQLHRWYDVYAFPVGEPENRQVGILFNDITPRKQSEESIKQLNKELESNLYQIESVNKELESFSYSVSHDLRAPLRGIHGYTQILYEDFGNELSDEAKRVMNKIMDNAKKMGQLIDDLLAFSRLGRKELTKMNLSMNEIVSGIYEELKKNEDHRDITFNINNLPLSFADSTTMKQVWINLISNSLKYSKRKEKTIIEIGSEIKGDEIIYYIKDNGAGFDMRYADKLFGVFQRLHSEEEFEGTGVGLAIVQRIISKHGGRIWAEGKVNEGAVFYFTLNKS